MANESVCTKHTKSCKWNETVHSCVLLNSWTKDVSEQKVAQTSSMPSKKPKRVTSNINVHSVAFQPHQLLQRNPPSINWQVVTQSKVMLPAPLVSAFLTIHNIIIMCVTRLSHHKAITSFFFTGSIVILPFPNNTIYHNYTKTALICRYVYFCWKCTLSGSLPIPHHTAVIKHSAFNHEYNRHYACTHDKSIISHSFGGCLHLIIFL